MRNRVPPCPESSKRFLRLVFPCEPERAQIGVEGADHSQIRIENTLTSENGEDVHLKPGARVKVRVRSPPAGNSGVKEVSDFPTA